jgi:hypothetical protein
VLSIEQEAIIDTFRRHALFPLDDCLYARQVTIPKLMHTSRHWRTVQTWHLAMFVGWQWIVSRSINGVYRTYHTIT